MRKLSPRRAPKRSGDLEALRDRLRSARERRHVRGLEMLERALARRSAGKGAVGEFGGGHLAARREGELHLALARCAAAGACLGSGRVERGLGRGDIERARRGRGGGRGDGGKGGGG